MITHDTLPPNGCWKAKYPSEFYRLLPRKRQMYRDNREYRHGIRYLIWSSYARCWYERHLSQADTEENIEYYVHRGMVWLWPDEEHQQEIREEVERSGLTYWKLRWRQHNEMLWEEHKEKANDGNGYRYWLDYRRAQIDKLKIKKK